MRRSNVRTKNSKLCGRPGRGSVQTIGVLAPAEVQVGQPERLQSRKDSSFECALKSMVSARLARSSFVEDS
eukprot:scaffold295479_cov33-Tisochrysis_lutea.AAC.1